MKSTTLKIEVRTNGCGGIYLAIIDVETGKIWADLELAHYHPTKESMLQSISFMETLKDEIAREFN